MSRPVVLCLTGSIGMGKSETARMFAAAGVPVFDADAAVHKLMARGGAAVEAVGAAFPGVVQDGAVDRKALGGRVFHDKPALKRLEAILHPLVRRVEVQFLEQAEANGERLVLLDIPLLFETGGEHRCDHVVVVSAPADVQRSRVLARPGMTPDRLSRILDQQMPDADKRVRADFIVDSSRGLADARRQVADIINQVTAQDPA